MGRKALDFEGKLLGCLRVLSRGTSKSTHESYWNCVCTRCNKESSVRANSLKTNRASCIFCRNKYRRYKEVLYLCRTCNTEFLGTNLVEHKYCSTKCKNTKIADKSSVDRKSSTDRYLSQLLTAIKNRAKKKELDFDIDQPFLLRLLINQDYKCAMSGLSLERPLTRTASLIDKYTISVDRIDSTKGYTKDNVRLVCYIANTAKNRFSDDELYEFCRGFINVYEEHRSS